MDGYRDLRQVLTALRAGRVDPDRLAEVGLGWTPGAATPFWDYLVEHGVVAPDPSGSSLPATIAWQPTPGPEETPSLAGDGSTPAFQIPTDPARDTVASARPANGPAASGSAVARYEVLRPHRAGGLGEVWLARDTAVGRDVALKTLRPDRLADPGLRTRFVHEARTTGQLEHPCVVPLYDLLPDADGRGPCYVMRFVAGRTLAEAVADYHARRARGEASRLDLAALLDAFVAVCRAVAFAHARGVLHRDLKGQNVVLGDFGEVFLLDWGLAKPVGEADATPTPSPTPAGPDEPTHSGALVGTPAYMAPEVAAGGPATKASDVYGLGAVLYAILTGRPPYDGASALEVVSKVTTADPPSPRAVVPDAPPALEAVCRQAMARDPAGRYVSADELATEVRRWLADEPVSAYRDPWTVRATRWARRHRTAVATAAVFLLTALVALTTSTALIWDEQRRTADQKRIAESEWKRAESERERAEGNLRAAQRLTAQVVDVAERSLPQTRENELVRRELTDAAAEVFSQLGRDQLAPAEQTLFAAQILRVSANVRRLLNETAAADKSYRESIRILRAAVERDPADRLARDRLAETLRDYASLRVKIGDLRGASDLLGESREIATRLQAEAPDRPAYKRTEAITLLDLATVEDARGRPTEAEGLARLAADLFGELLAAPPGERHPFDPMLQAAAWNRQAAIERNLGRPDAARTLHRNAVSALREMEKNEDNRGRLDNIQQFLARAVLEQSRTWADRPTSREAAEKNLTGTVTRWDDLRSRHPHVPMYRAWLAYAYQARGDVRALMGRTDPAREDFQKSREVLEALVAEFPALPGYRADLGRAYAGLARVTDGADAAVWNRKAIDALAEAVAKEPENARNRKLLDELRAGSAKGPPRP